MIRWRQIADSFRNAIEDGQLVEGAVIPPETELATQWSVSKMTVHRAMTELQNQGFIARKPRTGTVVAPRRQEAHHGNGRHEVADAAAERRPAAIALIIDDQRDRLAMEYVRGVSMSVPDTHKLLFFNTQGSIEREAECLRQIVGQVEGIVLFPIGGNREIPIVKEAIRAGIPVVALDREVEYDGISSVTSDNYGASMVGLRYLAERGHERIAHFTWDLSGHPEVAPVVERYDAWHTIMQKTGLGDPSRLLRQYPQHTSADLEHLTLFARDAVFAMLHQPDPPTAIFCVNDYFMIALLQACEDMRIGAPGQLEILSFNDGFQLIPRQARCVHRLVQRMEAMGVRAVELLMEHISDPQREVEHVRIPADFYPASALEHPSAPPKYPAVSDVIRQSVPQIEKAPAISRHC